MSALLYNSIFLSGQQCIECVSDLSTLKLNFEKRGRNMLKAAAENAGMRRVNERENVRRINKKEARKGKSEEDEKRKEGGASIASLQH